jgi:hypothetical protein
LQIAFVIQSHGLGSRDLESRCANVSARGHDQIEFNPLLVSIYTDAHTRKDVHCLGTLKMGYMRSPESGVVAQEIVAFTGEPSPASPFVFSLAMPRPLPSVVRVSEAQLKNSTNSNFLRRDANDHLEAILRQ